MATDNSLVCFKTIVNFTTELGEHFSSKQKSLKLYCRLINKTTLAHDKPIKKHIMAFKRFCVSNRAALREKDLSKLKATKIKYSDRVFIDMSHIFSLADRETISVIWNHLLCISALVDPAGKAKQILKENMKENKTGGQEGEFLTGIIDKIEDSVDINPGASPMEAIGSIMQSGIFTELIGGMQDGMSNGQLDMSKMMGAVQGMMSKLGEGSKGNPQAEQMFGMVNSMMQTLAKPPVQGKGDNEGKEVPVLTDGKTSPDKVPNPTSISTTVSASSEDGVVSETVSTTVQNKDTVDTVSATVSATSEEGTTTVTETVKETVTKVVPGPKNDE